VKGSQVVKRIALIGLSGSGKSSIAPLVADLLGWRVVDTDRLVEERFGLPIAEIFARYGESVFRAAEREALLQASLAEHVVIATGGGIVLDDRNWIPLRTETALVHLRARIETLVDRLHRQSERELQPTVRPLLAGDTAAKLQELWQRRRALYEQANVVIDTDDEAPEEIAQRIVEAVRELEDRGSVPFRALLGAAGRSELYVASGILTRIGELVRRRWPKARRAFLVSDEQVARYWGASARTSLTAADFDVVATAIPPGEHSKSLVTVTSLLDWMLAAGIERSDVVVALGGGVVGDVAGFAASIVLRGVALVQVPTSLLAMVDASVGGKTGVDHRLGKNLIGSFYQPHLVLADPVVLATLPAEERRSGWAEVVKHAMIECTATETKEPRLLNMLAERPYDAWWQDADSLARLIRQNIHIKASVVARDERESGLRRILNYGHTLGHAIEATSGYRLRHGEAIAVGMRAVARIAHRLDSCRADLVPLQDELLDQAGLPRAVDLPLADVLERLRYDKKAEGGRLTWILPLAPGHVEVRRDVPMSVIEDICRALLRTESRIVSGRGAGGDR
jgi:3-dehydroquinate synthase